MMGAKEGEACEGCKEIKGAKRVKGGQMSHLVKLSLPDIFHQLAMKKLTINNSIKQ